MIHPVILSGGSGTRLWPMSRSLYPKQLLALVGERSLLQQTVLRVAGDTGFAPPLIIANEEHRFIIAEQLREIGAAAEALVLEPVGRNTAPAACVAALRLAAAKAPGEPDALMLVMPSDHVIGDLAAFRAAIGRAAAAAPDFIRLDKAAFAECPSDSIDYAVMEHTKRAAVVPAGMGWSDLGSWDALWEMSARDERGNALSGNVVAEATSNCYLRSEAGLVAAVGVEDLVVVATDDAVMVAPRNRTQEVKTLVTRLLAERRDEADALSTVHRPWGTYRALHNGHRVQVKHIMVKPGAKLSLQMHHHRAEHWVVVQGTAKIVRGNEELVLTEDQSTYIPLGTAHRLENPGKIPLHVIEVQSGSYLGEDDIVRFEDHYGRQ